MGILGFILISGNQHSKKTNKEKPNIKSESPSIGIQFIQSEWSKVIEMAADEDKLIFVDLYSTACKPCQIMAQTVFTDSLVGHYFNQHFINVSYHFRNSSSGRYLKEKFTPNTYPTFYLIDQHERLVQQSTGIQTPLELIAMGQKAIERNKKAPNSF